MNTLISRTNMIGAVLFITAMLFTGSLFAQTAAVWRIQTWQQEDGGPYDQFAAFCEAGAPCVEVGAKVCLDGVVTCLTTTGNTGVDKFDILTGTHQLCLDDPSWKLVSGSTGAGQVNTTCVEKLFNGSGGFDHTTAMYLEINTVFTVTKVFSDVSAGTVTVGVTCSNSAVATAQGDGTLAHNESQDWVITNITTNTVCRAQESPVPAGYTGSGGTPQGRCSSGTLTEGSQGSCTITNTLNTDTIRVEKVYTDGSTTPVDVTMNCQSGNVDGTGNTYNTKSVAGGGFVSFTVTGFNQSTDASGLNTRCQITESNLPADYYQVDASPQCTQTMRHQDNAGVCTFTNGPDRATFIIEKIWDQVGDTNGLQVTAHLSCTGANVTQQNVVFTATTDAILFVYDINKANGQVDCTVTEDVPAGYRATYNCNGEDCGDSGEAVNACFYGDVDPFGVYTCTITNRPLPAVVTVTKTWVIEGADQGYDGGHFIVGICDSVVRGPTGDGGCFQGTCFAAVRQEDASAGSKDYEFTVVKPRYPWTECTFFEDADDSVVESDNGCGRLRLSAADTVECEIVNTVFFEGIPTLNQYGMAILALLMLGVGFVGFRRFT